MQDRKLVTEKWLDDRGDTRHDLVNIIMIIEGRALITTITGHLHRIICEGTGTLLWEKNTSRT